jgi:hypothetical protein
MGAMCVLASDGFFRRVPRLIAHGLGSYQEAEPLAAGNHFLERWFFLGRIARCSIAAL